jgi:hypothetical protein
MRQCAFPKFEQAIPVWFITVRRPGGAIGLKAVQLERTPPERRFAIHQYGK